MADVEIPDAPTINRQLTTLVLEAGRRLGFEVASEYAISGRRLDIVWLWKPAAPLPNFDGAIPVVGFEIESSWLSRKHVKGDLLNLQDAGVALGVMVLAGSGEKDESLRRFAQALVDRPGTRVLVWTEGDVHALIDGKLSTDLPFHLVDAENIAYERVDVEEVAIRSAQKNHSGSIGRSGNGFFVRTIDRSRSPSRILKVRWDSSPPTHADHIRRTGIATVEARLHGRSSMRAGVPNRFR